MYKIDTPTANNNEFVDGNVTTGIPPTALNAEWFNHVQTELVNLLEILGGTVDATKRNQISNLIDLKIIELATNTTNNKTRLDNQVGSVVFFPTLVTLDGYLLLKRGTYNKSSYQDLWGWIIARGDLVTTDTSEMVKFLDLGTQFSVPSYKDLFPRFIQEGTTRYQSDAGRNITGSFGGNGLLMSGGVQTQTGALTYNGNYGNGTSPSTQGGSGGGFDFDASRVWGSDHTANEFRSKNVGLFAYIKY